MAQDSFTEVTSQSWFGRLGNAAKGVVVGVIIFLISFFLLFWNEGRAVKRFKTLQEGGGAVISVEAGAVDLGNEGKLVHVTGEAVTGETLTDPDFGLAANALKLKRTAQMYQWRENAKSETKKKLGGGTETVTTYSYSKAWAEEPISSSSFKKPSGHQNPGSMPYLSQELTAGEVTLGAFKLTPTLVRKIDNYTPLPVEKKEALPEGMREKAKISNRQVYFGKDPGSPAIGDTRVFFEVVEPTTVSLISRQVRNTFEPYRAKAGGTIQLLSIGTYSADGMIQTAQEGNKVLTWILRLVGFFLMFMGLGMVFKPLSVVADVLPIAGDIVGAGTGLVALLLAAGLSMVTIAIAWLVYRPLLGIILLAVAGGLIYGVIRLLKKYRAGKKNEEPVETTA